MIVDINDVQNAYKETYRRKPSPNDLSEEEYQIYLNFKKIIEDQHIPIYDETFLIRYLQARDFNLNDSVKLALRVAKLRKERGISKVTIDKVKPEYNSGVLYYIK